MMTKRKTPNEADDTKLGGVLRGIGGNGDPNIDYVSASSLMPDPETARRYSRADQLATRRMQQRSLRR